MFNLRGPQGQNPRTTCGPRTTVWKTLPYANEWLLCKHYWDSIHVHSPLRLETIKDLRMTTWMVETCSLTLYNINKTVVLTCRLINWYAFVGFILITEHQCMVVKRLKMSGVCICRRNSKYLLPSVMFLHWILHFYQAFQISMRHFS